MSYLYLGLLLIIFFILVGLVIKSFINKKKEEGFSNLLLMTGFSMIITSFGTLLDKLITLCAILKSDSDQVSNIVLHSGEINYIQLTVGVFLILVYFGLKYYNSNKKYIVNIKGYDFSKNIENNHKDIGLSNFEFKEREIDFSSIFNNGSDDIMTNKVILEILKQKISSFKIESEEFKRGYTGIAPIPYIMYAGTLLRRVKIDEYYEYNKLDGQKYFKLKDKIYFFKKEPDLKLKTNLDELDKNISEIVISISVTSSITESDFLQFNGIEAVELAIDQPGDNKIKSKHQLEKYYKKIYDTILKLDKSLSNLNKIHILYAGQSCLALEIGKIIEENRMPEIINYHYNSQSSYKYPWGLVLNGHNKGGLTNYKGEITNV